MLIGDFNQAAQHMVTDLQQHLLDTNVHLYAHDPGFEDCLAIFGFGIKAPTKETQLKRWKQLNGAHRPIALHFGKDSKRNDEAAASRKRKASLRLARSKNKRSRFEPEPVSEP